MINNDFRMKEKLSVLEICFLLSLSVFSLEFETEFEMCQKKH